LKEIDEKVAREHWGNRMYLNDQEYLTETQTSYQVITIGEIETLVKEFTITQNEKGIDTENRIEKIKKEIVTLKCR
jgi:hypothetical protein